MTGRALSFGTVAAAYERYRPGYPDELVDTVLAYARRPVRAALEIGAGTGKATRVFARRGIAVTATEPDAAMLAELRARVPPGVAAVRAAFEEVPLGATYDLVFAAAALHWTRANGRWLRAAGLLRPGGVFASFGGPLRLADPEVEEAVREARGDVLPDDGVPSPDGTPESSPMQWPGSELVRSELFADVRQVVIERRVSMTADDYIGHLSTVSAYLELPDNSREQVFTRILEVIPAEVALAADLVVHLARRR